MFGDFFGWWRWGSRNADRPRRWTDVVLNLKIKFEDVYYWATKKIKYKRDVLCEECDGKWVSKSSNVTTCTTCGGHGVVLQSQRTAFWMVQTQTTCPTCHWKWKTGENPCHKCNSQWVYSKDQLQEVNVPKWIDSNTRIKFPWMWNYGYKWWTPGDLYIEIKIDDDSMRIKRWHDIIIKKEVNLIDAILWWTMEVSLPDKNINVKIPKWLQFNENIVVSWNWFKKWDSLLSWKWDLIIQADIKIPKNLSKQEKDLYEQLKKFKK
jgi:molecular chaperone DnaJ